MQQATLQARLQTLHLQAQARARLELRRRERVAEPEAGDVIEWIESRFYIPELRGPIRLAPYQRAVLREAHRRDETGRFVYNVVVWSDIKKSAKSSIAAAVALDRAYRVEWGSVKLIANDLKQADSRVAFYLRRAIALNVAMAATVKQVRYKTTLPNQATIEAIPIDPAGEAGGNDDLIVFSELWGATTDKALQMWAESTLSPTKFGYSQRWIETYAGYVGESVLLEQLYEANVKPEYRIDLSYTEAPTDGTQATDDTGHYHDLSDLEVYAHAGQLCLWNTIPRLEWQTPEYYAAEEGVQLPNEFLRIHRNQWVSSVSKFVPDEWWMACWEMLPPLDSRESMILAVDAGVSDDNFALVGVTRRNGRTYIRYTKRWEPPAGGKIDYLGTPEFPGPEREIVRLCFKYNVTEVRYDPYQLHDMMTRLGKGVKVNKNGNMIREGEWSFKTVKINTVEFSQGAPRLEADKQFYDKIRDGRVVHGGDDDLARHIQNANAKTEDGRLRIVKRSQALKIDLAVAASTAAYEAGVKEKDKKKPTRAMRVTR